MKKINIYQVIGIPAIIAASVYFYAYVKANEFPTKVNTTNYSIVKR